MTFEMDEFGHLESYSSIDVASNYPNLTVDTSEIQWRKKFINFSKKDEARLEALGDTFQNSFRQSSDNFYDHLVDFEETREILDRSDRSIEQLKLTQREYLESLFGGTYDESYFQQRIMVGEIHNRLQMPMKQYLGQFLVYFESIVPLLSGLVRDRIQARIESSLALHGGASVVSETGPSGNGHASPSNSAPSDESDPVSAVQRLYRLVEEELDRGSEDLLSILRIVNLDMQVVVDAYIHSYHRSLMKRSREQRTLMAAIERDLHRPITAVSESADSITDRTAAVEARISDRTMLLGSTASELTSLSSSIEEIAATTESVATAGEDSRSLAKSGADAANDALSAMSGIETAIDNVSYEMEHFLDRLSIVTEFTDVIDTIADQTNLLALNASIEAARAGSKGDGFAVVAGEIKSLAAESRDRAAAIETTITELRANGEAVKESLNDARNRCRTGTSNVETVVSALDDILVATTEVANGIGEAAEATEMQATTTESVAGTIDTLADDLEAIREEIDAIATDVSYQQDEIRSITVAADRLGRFETNSVMD